MSQRLIFPLAGVIALILGLLFWYGTARPPQGPPPGAVVTRSATVLPEFKPLPPFSLSDQQGKVFDNRRLMGHWTFLDFGYTHCPDVCPTTLAMLTNMDQQLKEGNVAAPYQIAFVSVDPERDSQARLAEYIGYFDPAFLGVRGSDAELQKLTRPLGIPYAKVQTEKSAMGYVMDHSASLILIDPQGRYHALFSPPHDARLIAEDFMRITESY
jgi:protein SCO1